MADNKNAQVMTPGKQDRVSIQKVSMDKEERKEFNKQFREQKEYEQKIKEERFAAIKERRQRAKSGNSPSGRGININVDSDK